MMTGWSVTEKRGQTFPHLDVVLSGKMGGELWVANPEVVSGPRGGTEEEEEPHRLQILDGRDVVRKQPVVFKPLTEAVT